MNARHLNLSAKFQNTEMIEHTSSRLEYPFTKAASTASESISKIRSAPSRRSLKVDKARTGSSHHFDRNDLRRSRDPFTAHPCWDQRCKLAWLCQASIEHHSTNPIGQPIRARRPRVSSEPVGKNHDVRFLPRETIDSSRGTMINETYPLHVAEPHGVGGRDRTWGLPETSCTVSRRSPSNKLDRPYPKVARPQTSTYP